MKKIFITTFFLASVAMLSMAQESTSTFVTEATLSLKNNMKDPDSTQFRNLREITNTVNEKVLCGEVNSKNSYGGYVGFMPFSYNKEGTAILNGTSNYNNYLNTSIYKKSGCAGEKSEITERNPNMFKDYCSIVYQLFTDILADKKSEESAINIAIESYKNHNLEVFNKNLDQVKADFLTNINQVSSNPDAVKKISKKSKNFQNQYMQQCPRMMRSSYI